MKFSHEYLREPAYNPSMRGQLTTAEAVREFALAGNARLTIVSKATGARFTYQIKKRSDSLNHTPLWFVSLLRGPDNEADYQYLGTLREGVNHDRSPYYLHGSKSRVYQTAPSVKAFVWFWKNLQDKRLSPQLEVWHEGRCGRCGRLLTVPTSIARGIGPECAGLLRQADLFNSNQVGRHA